MNRPQLTNSPAVAERGSDTSEIICAPTCETPLTCASVGSLLLLRPLRRRALGLPRGRRRGLFEEIDRLSDRVASVRHRRLAAVVVGSVLLLALSGCSVDEISNQISIPDPVTDSGDRIFHLWQGTWIALWVIGLFTWALMLGAAWFYRRRSEDYVPKQTRYNVPIEVLYTVTPMIVIMVFAWFTIRDGQIITEVKNDQTQTVNVVGYQWNWAFNYTDEDVYEVGSPSDLPTLYLPVGEKVQFVLTSPDVIHSFWIPDFLMKLDVVPGRANRFEVTPTVEGTYAGKCAELCGTYHSQMLFWVEVVSPEVFDEKMEELRLAGQTGELETDRPNTDAQNQGNTRIGDDS